MIRVYRVKMRKVFIIGLIILVSYFVAKSAVDGMGNRKVAALSWSVANKVIVIDPGHGGIDPGSKGYNGAIEKEITLDVATKLGSVLSQAGAIVLMTRESDVDLSNPDGGSLIARKRQDLARRVGLANENDADAFISIHVNSFKSGPGEHGAQTFYQPKSVEGGQLAKSIQGELVRMLKNTNRKAKAVDYFATRNAEMPAAIVEIGFISNAKEEKLMVNPDYQAKIAYAIYSGVVKYFANAATPTNGAIVDIDEAVETFQNNKGNIFDAP